MINTIVATVVLICFVVSYRYPKKVASSAYAAVLLPIIPIITALLLGRQAIVISLIYVLILGLVSGFIAIYSSITTTELLNAGVRDYASKLEEEALARQKQKTKHVMR